MRQGLPASLSLFLAIGFSGCGGAAGPRNTPPASTSSAALAAAGAVTSGGPAAAGSAAAAGGVKITTSFSVASPGFWPLFMAADTGIFQANGLDASVQAIAGAPASAAALISGQLQFAQFGGGAAMSAAVNGSDLVILTIMVPVDQFVIYGGPAIKTPQDLKGKKLGVVALGGSEDNVAMRSALRSLGMDPDKDVSILAVGQDRVSALVNGSIAAATLTPPDTIQAQAAGFHPVFDMAAAKLPHLGQSTVTSRAYVNAHRDVAQKYVDSMIEGIAKLKQDRAMAIAVLGQRIKSDDQQAMGVAWDFYTKEIFPNLPAPKPELFQDAITELSKEDPKIASVDPKSLVDPSFVQNAADRGLGKASS
jgi:NitT/TauT family transport system substrate-binding protein